MEIIVLIVRRKEIPNLPGKADQQDGAARRGCLPRQPVPHSPRNQRGLSARGAQVAHRLASENGVLNQGQNHARVRICLARNIP